MNTGTEIIQVTVNDELVEVEQSIRNHSDSCNLPTGITRHTRFYFDNNYEVSIVNVIKAFNNCERPGLYYCTVDTDTYEVAILLNDKVVYDIDIPYGEDSSTLGDVCGYITREEVDFILREVQKLPKDK